MRGFSRRLDDALGTLWSPGLPTDKGLSGAGGERDALETVVKDIEAEMWERAARVAEMSKTNLEAFVNAGAPQTALDRFAAFAEMEEREG